MPHYFRKEEENAVIRLGMKKGIDCAIYSPFQRAGITRFFLLDKSDKDFWYCPDHQNSGYYFSIFRDGKKDPTVDEEIHIFGLYFVNEPELQRLPENLQVFKEIKSLHVLNCPLEDISEISKFPTLEELILEKVSLKALPKSIVNLKNLQRISIIGTELEEFPTFLAQMPQLKRLVLKNLSSPLKTSSPRLVKLNPAIWDIPSLEELVLIGFNAQEISPKIGNWEHLERFHFEGNCPKTLPDSIGKCKKLRELVLDGVAAPLPESFGDLFGLRTIHLANELILGLPHSIYRLSNLETVLFRTHGDFHLPAWPEQLQTIPNLRTFIFKGKCSAPLPDWLGNFEKLKRIILYGVLGPIPDTFGNLKNLSALEMLDSKIPNIPRSLSRLSRFQCLALENCGLTDLPDYFGEFRELTELYLRNNPIKKLPSSILQCQNLWGVDLRGCPIEDRKFLERFYDIEGFRYVRIDEIN